MDQYHQLLVQHLREHEHLGSEWAGQVAEEDRRQARLAILMYSVCVCVSDAL